MDSTLHTGWMNHILQKELNLLESIGRRVGRDGLLQAKGDFMHKDSKFIKIITFIPMLYTPASLMVASDSKKVAMHKMSTKSRRLYLVPTWYKSQAISA